MPDPSEAVAAPVENGGYVWKVGGTGVSFPSDDIPDSVVSHLDHYWAMDDGGGDTVSDSVGDRPLTTVGATFENDYLTFAGDGDRAEEPNGDSRFNGFNNFTWFGWIRPDVAPTNDPDNNLTICGSYETDGNDRSWTLYNREDTTSDTNDINSVASVLSEDGENISGANFDDTEDHITPLEWQSFAYVRDGGESELYVNGSLVSSDTHSVNGQLHESTVDLWVGSIMWTSDRDFVGDMMDHGINTTEALSASAIQSLHEDTGPNSDGGGETTTLTTDGGWNYRDRPVAIEKDNILFYSYIDSDGNQIVASYDPDTGESDSTVVETTGGDLHNNPAILLTDTDHIVAFQYPFDGSSTDNNNELFWRVSDNPLDVSSFGPVQSEEFVFDNSYTGRAASPYVDSNGNWYVQDFYRRDGGNGPIGEMLWISEDEGDTWEKRRLWELTQNEFGTSDRNYTSIWGENDYIHFIATKRDLSGSSQIGYGVFYAKYDILNEEFLAADGSFLFDWTDTPITDEFDLDVVWHRDVDGNGASSGMWMDIKTDSSGTPHITFWTSPNDDEPPFTRYWARPENGSWEYYEIDSSTYDLSYWTSIGPSASLDPRDPTGVFVDCVTDESNESTRIDKMSTSDGGANWSVEEQISTEMSKTHFPNAIYGIDSASATSVVWLEGTITDWTNYNTSLHTND